MKKQWCLALLIYATFATTWVEANAQSTPELNALPNGRLRMIAKLSEEDARKAAALDTTLTKEYQELGLTGKNVKVGVIDTGIDWKHPAFAIPGKKCTTFAGEGCRVKYGKDFVGDNFDGSAKSIFPDNDPMDCNGHGTHVAGIIGGLDEKIGGVAPDVTFGAYRVAGCKAGPLVDNVIEAMEQAAADGMNIINLSVGFPNMWGSRKLAEAATNIANKGIIIVGAVGNTGGMGLYRIENPMNVKEAIGVANIYNSFIFLKYMIVNGKKLKYCNVEGNDDFAKRGIKNATVVPASLDLQLNRNGCPEFSENQFQGKVALIQFYVTCSLADVVELAHKAGAIGVVFYPRIEEPLHLEEEIGNLGQFNVPVVFMLREDAGTLLNSAKDSFINVFFPSADETFGFPHPGAGQPVESSTWGFGTNLEIKPDIAAIGDPVTSAYPQSMGDGYKTIGGTSMASPYIAGAVAAYLQAFPGSRHQTILEALQNTARPSRARSTSNVEFAYSVVKQGAGLVDALAFVTSTTRVFPSRLALNDTSGNQMFKRKRITITNNGNKETKYTVEHLPAQSINGEDVTAPKAFNAAARVTASPSSLTVGPGQSQLVDITIFPDTRWDDSDRVIYSGYIKITPESPKARHSPIYVPYAGFKGNYNGIRPLSNDIISLPGGRKLPPPSIVKLLQMENGTLSLNHYDKTPFHPHNGESLSVAFHVNHPARNITLLWVDAETGQEVGAAGNLSDASPIIGESPPASYVPIDKNRCLPKSGLYKFNLTLEYGFVGGPLQVQYWVSDPFEIVHNGQLKCTTA
ncbi:peptidase S8/S53 domain-containing protein [Paraphysoderma sedebokerense]|nr:peptidase S8/S53 domain-containing protein [Paraphysoderma sedebokerense]